jgi:hypothetical protein
MRLISLLSRRPSPRYRRDPPPRRNREFAICGKAIATHSPQSSDQLGHGLYLSVFRRDRPEVPPRPGTSGKEDPLAIPRQPRCPSPPHLGQGFGIAACGGHSPQSLTVGQLACRASTHRHDPDFAIAGPVGKKQDVLAVWRPPWVPVRRGFGRDLHPLTTITRQHPKVDISASV